MNYPKNKRLKRLINSKFIYTLPLAGIGLIGTHQASNAILNPIRRLAITRPQFPSLNITTSPRLFTNILNQRVGLENRTSQVLTPNYVHLYSGNNSIPTQLTGARAILNQRSTLNLRYKFTNSNVQTNRQVVLHQSIPRPIQITSIYQRSNLRNRPEVNYSNLRFNLNLSSSRNFLNLRDRQHDLNPIYSQLYLKNLVKTSTTSTRLILSSRYKPLDSTSTTPPKSAKPIETPIYSKLYLGDVYKTSKTSTKPITSDSKDISLKPISTDTTNGTKQTLLSSNTKPKTLNQINFDNEDNDPITLNDMTSDFGASIKSLSVRALSNELHNKKTSGSLNENNLEKTLDKFKENIKVESIAAHKGITKSSLAFKRLALNNSGLDSLDDASNNFGESISNMAANLFKSELLKFEINDINSSNISEKIKTTSNKFGNEIGDISANELTKSVRGFIDLHIKN